MTAPTLAFHDSLPPLEENPFNTALDFTTCFSTGGAEDRHEVFVRAPTVARLMEWSNSNPTYRMMRKQCDSFNKIDTYGSGEARVVTFVEVAALLAFLVEYERHGKTRRSESVRKYVTETIMADPNLRSTISGDWTA